MFQDVLLVGVNGATSLCGLECSRQYEQATSTGMFNSTRHYALAVLRRDQLISVLHLLGADSDWLEGFEGFVGRQGHHK